jgi:hypothetical protein
MSSTFQTVVRGPSLTGLGKRPVFTPCHQVERPTGIGPSGARIEVRRTKPSFGKECVIVGVEEEFALSDCMRMVPSVSNWTLATGRWKRTVGISERIFLGWENRANFPGEGISSALL